MDGQTLPNPEVSQSPVMGYKHLGKLEYEDGVEKNDKSRKISFTPP